MAKIDSDTLYGTLNLLILKTLGGGPLHGLAVLRRIHEVTADGLRVEEGALYPALHRLERDGLVTGTWGLSENRRRAKFYELTPAGAAAPGRRGPAMGTSHNGRRAGAGSGVGGDRVTRRLPSAVIEPATR